MKNRNVAKHLQMKIRRYFEYMHEEEKFGEFLIKNIIINFNEGSQRGTYLVSYLSSNLKYEVNNEAYGVILKENKLFKKVLV